MVPYSQGVIKAGWFAKCDLTDFYSWCSSWLYTPLPLPPKGICAFPLAVNQGSFACEANHYTMEPTYSNLVLRKTCIGREWNVLVVLQAKTSLKMTSLNKQTSATWHLTHFATGRWQFKAKIKSNLARLDIYFFNQVMSRKDYLASSACVKPAIHCIWKVFTVKIWSFFKCFTGN